eukprot:CAMPEP_0118657490 /NCGR_PEP_ID=MMETSP0785-20121206/14049_1 /TAXON_ID=91992 /ORGANISM="Bolidomonas pacifica, Strain CCMP 1866" /LENGTH=351 /DNA_ID=CAMNT_0006550417 /DNA_START=113 /DNA_END=1165 /DNA_ORIENTATION=+
MAVTDSNPSTTSLPKGRKRSRTSSSGSNSSGGRSRVNSGDNNEGGKKKPRSVKVEESPSSSKGNENAERVEDFPVPPTRTIAVTSDSNVIVSSSIKTEPQKKKTNVKSTTKTHNRSPICPTLPPRPLQSSTLVLDHFGPLTQTVHDLLYSLGPTTLPVIKQNLKAFLGKQENQDRKDLLQEVKKLGKGTVGKSNGSASRGYLVDATTIQSCLRVLMIHSIVTCGDGGIKRGTGKDNKKRGVYYEVDIDRGCRMGRYQKYLAHVNESFDRAVDEDDSDDEAGGLRNGIYGKIVKYVMFEGLAMTEDIVLGVEELYRDEEDEEDDEDNAEGKGHDFERMKEIGEGIIKLVDEG